MYYTAVRSPKHETKRIDWACRFLRVCCLVFQWIACKPNNLNYNWASTIPNMSWLFCEMLDEWWVDTRDLNWSRSWGALVQVNDPLRIDGVTAYQTDWSIAAVTARALVVLSCFFHCHIWAVGKSLIQVGFAWNTSRVRISTECCFSSHVPATRSNFLLREACITFSNNHTILRKWRRASMCPVSCRCAPREARSATVWICNCPWPVSREGKDIRDGFGDPSYLHKLRTSAPACKRAEIHIFWVMGQCILLQHISESWNLTTFISDLASPPHNQ